MSDNNVAVFYLQQQITIPSDKDLTPEEKFRFLKDFISEYIKYKESKKSYSNASINGTKTALSLFSDYVIKCNPEKITEEVIEAFKSSNKKLAATSVNNYIGEVKRFFNWLSVKKGIKNEASLVKPKKVPNKDGMFKKPFDKEQVEKLRIYFSECVAQSSSKKRPDQAFISSLRNQAIFEFALRTGLRQMVVLEGEKSDIFYREKKRYLKYRYKGEDKKLREHPISDVVYQTLCNYWEQCPYPTSMLFSSHQSMKVEKALSKSTVKKMFKEAVDGSGVLEGVHKSELNNVYTFHSIRHAYGTNVTYEYGAEVAQEMMGHSSQVTTQTYNKMARRKRAMDKSDEIDKMFD